jgi:hypothetical protein
VRTLDAQDAGLSIGLQIVARDDLAVHQERQDIVAVDALLGRGVYLELIADTEQTFGARPMPDERIERGKQRLTREPTTRKRIAVKIGCCDQPSTCTGTISPSWTSCSIGSRASSSDRRK